VVEGASTIVRSIYAATRRTNDDGAVAVVVAALAAAAPASRGAPALSPISTRRAVADGLN
jgi:hypothetical protein